METGAGEPEAVARSEYRRRDLRLPEAAKSKADIVEFRAPGPAAAAKTACDKHLAVGQQRRRVKIASSGEATGGRPAPRRTGEDIRG